jgi:hypothetical protein
MAPALDPLLDHALDLEERCYAEGYAQGELDGRAAGRLEGRSAGLARGFDKFLEAGRLYGKATVWANRLPISKAQDPGTDVTQNHEPCSLLSLPMNARLEKNILALHALVEPDTLSTQNDDESVGEFDDRIKKARGKAKVVERTVGEDKP